MGRGPITASVGLLRFSEAGGTFAGFLTSEISKPIILPFRVMRGVMVEGYRTIRSAIPDVLKIGNITSPPPPSCVAGKDIPAKLSILTFDANEDNVAIDQ